MVATSTGYICGILPCGSVGCRIGLTLVWGIDPRPEDPKDGEAAWIAESSSSRLGSTAGVCLYHSAIYDSRCDHGRLII